VLIIWPDQGYEQVSVAGEISVPTSWNNSVRGHSTARHIHAAHQPPGQARLSPQLQPPLQCARLTITVPRDMRHGRLARTGHHLLHQLAIFQQQRHALTRQPADAQPIALRDCLRFYGRHGQRGLATISLRDLDTASKATGSRFTWLLCLQCKAQYPGAHSLSIGFAEHSIAAICLMPTPRKHHA
jgi:hypothetical protein